MKKILIAGAGGAPSEGVIKSLLQCNKGDTIIGMGSEIFDLVQSNAKTKYLIPNATEPNYKNELFKLIDKEKPDFIHFQNDLEIFEASKIRDQIHRMNVKTFMPDRNVIDICVNKYKSWLTWTRAGLKVPQNILINNQTDLKKAFSTLGDENGNIWLRSSTIGGGGKGALPTADYDFAKGWIDRFKGWGYFTAAEILSADSITWLSIWYEGELVVAQTRKRRGWTHGNRTLSGVTGVTKVGETFSDEATNSISIDSIKTIDNRPHGIYGVDLTYDKDGVPNPTEINISRFFTTILFFTQAGLNMPKIYKDIALYNEFPSLEKIINPLADGLLWIRGMDQLPIMIDQNEIFNSISELA